MMMKKLITTLAFILAVVWLSFAIAAKTAGIPLNQILNRACIQFNWEEKCATAVVPYWDQGYSCDRIYSPSSVVEFNGTDWTMRFTCYASDSSTSHRFYINCGNGIEKAWEAYGSFTYTCNYSSTAEFGSRYKAYCVVDDEVPTSPACEKYVSIGYGFWLCGNGILEIWEDCDLRNDSSLHSINTPVTINTYLDLAHTTLAWNDQGKQCKKCKVIDNTGNYVYEPAECLYTDTPISVMEEEIVPYWWKLWIKDTQVVEEYDACKEAAASYEKTSVDDEKTLLLNDEDHPMKCKFAVYNYNHNQGNGQKITTFEEDCFNDNFGENKIYRYFDEYHKTSSDGASSEKSKLMTTDIAWDYWEYKLVLEEVEYKYCDKLQWKWKDWQRYGAVCEVNFAVTKPYVMQISTFGANPVAATQPNNFLKDFYDMNWNRIIKKTDLEDIISVDNDTYAISYDVDDKFNEFKEKYWKIAVRVNTNNVKVGNESLNQIFDGHVEEVKKVPNKSIYFIKWSWKLKLSQDKISKFTSAYTLIVEWMDVEIKWNVLQYAMIVTDKKMTFVDNWPEGLMSCASGWQVVQWIFVASKWFYWDDRNYNWNVNENRCPWWWLHVKWVLIWDNIEDLMDAKRSQLNSWFNSDDLNDQAVLLERRQKIIWWAAVLIEYSPKLWKTLPPWAEIFTESLEVYRK